MIRFSARGAYFTFGTSREGRIFGTGRFFMLQNKTSINKMSAQLDKTSINIKITNNTRNRNSNKLLKVQLLLKELFVLAVTNIRVSGFITV